MAKEAALTEPQKNDGQEPRKLNMEEKRKVEKLLLADIDTAVQRYDADAKAKRQGLIKKLASNPPAEVKRHFDRHSAAKKQQADVEAKLRRLGYGISGYDEKLSVRECDPMTPELAEFDALTQKNVRSLQDLKRSYVIKLFADHADTQSLFAGLAEDLERLAK